jgi:hypothetical protein
MIAINFGLLPLMIDLAVKYEDYGKQSSVVNAVISRIFFFMFLNTVVLPISETSSAIVFAKNLRETDILSWPAFLSNNLMNHQYFYIKFMIQLTFVTNGLSYLDAPHKVKAWYGRWQHNRKQRSSLFKTEYVDDYKFDLAYNQSYCLVIFLNCLLFSTLVPFIPFFGSLYFYMKYLVDKNNLLFVYKKTYESGGHIRQSVRHYLVFNLYLYMLVMASFYGLKFRRVYSWLGPLVVLAWTLVYIYYTHQIEPHQNYMELRSRLASRAMQKSPPTKSIELQDQPCHGCREGNLRRLEQGYLHPFEKQSAARQERQL